MTDQHVDISSAGRPPAERPHHPVVVAQQHHRGADAQLRLADAITRLAGSMSFVYVHVVVFAAWMIFLERSPWPTLTLVVSLEAIFLSTFVMIGQNRQSAFAQAKADHDFVEQETELKTNTELTREIHALTSELHRRVVVEQRGIEPGGPAPDGTPLGSPAPGSPAPHGTAPGRAQ